MPALPRSALPRAAENATMQGFPQRAPTLTARGKRHGCTWLRRWRRPSPEHRYRVQVRPRSSTPSPTKPRSWRPTRCCRSSRPSPPPPASPWKPATSRWPAASWRSFPEYLSDAQKVSRRPGRTGRAGDHAGSQHHQAAEHQRLGAAAEGRHQGTAGPGLRAAGLPGRRPTDDADSGHQGALRQGQGQRREPGAARRQLRPPRAAVGEELRAQAPAPMGAWSQGLQVARRAHGRAAISTAARSRPRWPTPAP